MTLSIFLVTLPLVSTIRDALHRLPGDFSVRTSDHERSNTPDIKNGEPAHDHAALQTAADRLRYSAEITDSDLDTVVSALDSPDPEARLLAAKALAGVPNSSRTLATRSVPALIERLDDEKSSVRRSSAKALRRIAKGSHAEIRAHAPELADHLVAYNVRVSDNVATALSEAASSFPKELAPLVFPYIDAETGATAQRSAIIVLQSAAKASPAAVKPILPRLVELLERRPNHRLSIIEILAAVADEYPAPITPAVTELVRCAEEGTDEEREAAIGTLAYSGKAEPSIARPAVHVLTTYLAEGASCRGDAVAQTLVAIATQYPDERQTILDVLEKTDSMGTWHAARRLHATTGEVGAEIANAALSDSFLHQFLD